MDRHYNYLIIGGGLAIAARLRRKLKNQTIALIEPSSTPYYQPLWTLAGAGLHTLQHIDYKNIFGVGDVAGIPNSKTTAAIRKQAPIVVENLLAVAKGEAPKAHYDGYSACPIITDKVKVILAEFGYDGTLMPTFPFDMSQQRRSM